MQTEHDEIALYTVAIELVSSHSDCADLLGESLREEEWARKTLERHLQRLVEEVRKR